jgi:hypothetical protein
VFVNKHTHTKVVEKTEKKRNVVSARGGKEEGGGENVKTEEGKEGVGKRGRGEGKSEQEIENIRKRRKNITFYERFHALSGIQKEGREGLKE